MDASTVIYALHTKLRVLIAAIEASAGDVNMEVGELIGIVEALDVLNGHYEQVRAVEKSAVPS